MTRASILAMVLALASAGCGPRNCKDVTPDHLNLGMEYFDNTGWPTLWDGRTACTEYTFCQPGYGVVKGCYFRSQSFPVTPGTIYRLLVTLTSPKGALVRLEWLDSNGQLISNSDTKFATDTYDNQDASPAKAPAGAASARVYLEATDGASCFAGVSLQSCQ